MRVFYLPSLVFAVGSAACSHDKLQIVNEHVLTEAIGQKTLPIGGFSDATWSYFGFYDKDGTFEHQYGGPSEGYFEYSFRAGAGPWTGITVRARLSAEAKDKGKPDESSDVTLSIDGRELGTQTVIPDDMLGVVYTWQSQDQTLLQKLASSTVHTLRFEVKADAAHRHGLCLYGEALDGKDMVATPPSIELTPAKP